VSNSGTYSRDDMTGLACFIGWHRRLREIGVVPVSGRPWLLLRVACVAVPLVAVIFLDGKCFFHAQAGSCNAVVARLSVHPCLLEAH
jgi:hypothetical protein